ncbi:Membrane protein [Candidatus Magnetomoraceae bacterium gMMP-15]
MIFKTFCIIVCIVLAFRFTVKAFRQREYRLISLLSAIFWFVTALILGYSHKIKTFLVMLLSLHEFDNAADVFIHGAILIYPYFMIKIMLKIYDMDKKLKILSREIALLDKSVRSQNEKDI